MKKILLTLIALGSFTFSNAQGYNAPIDVIVKNYTNFNLYFAPRYNLAFYDGVNDTTYFDVPNSDIFGVSSPIKDFDFQDEGQFEMIPPQTMVKYSNGNTGFNGFPLEPNSFDTFNTAGLAAYNYDNYYFHKIMKLSWIRFALSKGTLEEAPYGGGLAYDFDPSGMTQVGPYNYKNSNGEMFRYYWPSFLQFTVNGTPVEAVFISSPFVNGQPGEVHIVFYHP